MSDFDETVYSPRRPAGQEGGTPPPSLPASPPPASAPPPAKPKRNWLLIIGGVGCLGLICIALLLAGGAFVFRAQLGVDPLAGLVEPTATPTVETPTPLPATPLPTDTPVATAVEVKPTVESTVEATVEATIEATVESTEAAAVTPTEEASPTPTTEPKFSKITFALGATEDYKPINPGLTFQEGITQVHAIFEYSGMSKELTWERVWYLDDQQILKNSQKWTGDSAGVFDYFVDAGNEPLFPGKWVLQLFVEGDKLVEGKFTIKPEATPTVPATKETEPTADLTPTPTSTLTATATVTPTKAASSGGGVYDLVYTKWDGGQHNMYVADTTGKGERFLFGRAAGPSWTPDGQEIFFFGEAGVDRQLLADGREFVFDGVSNGIVALVNAAALPSPEAAQLYQSNDWKQGTARWANVSPDGSMVAFDAKPGGDYRVYFLGTADNQQFRFEIIGEQADWSPNSQKIVYRSGRDGKTGIWISNRDDSGHTNITNGGSDSFPAWSPDGKTIAFSRDEGGNVDIYTVNVDGSNLQRLTDAPGPDSLPTYTPSGDIIFRSARSGAWGIWKMSGDGANQQEIIPNAGVGPDWSFSKMDAR